jgi:hypothetical protein
MLFKAGWPALHRRTADNDPAEDAGVADDQAQFPVVVERVVGEVLRAEEQTDAGW